METLSIVGKNPPQGYKNPRGFPPGVFIQPPSLFTSNLYIPTRRRINRQLHRTGQYIGIGI